MTHRAGCVAFSAAACTLVFLAAPVFGQVLSLPVAQVSADELPIQTECRDGQYPLLALVHNSTLVPRRVYVEALLLDEGGVLMSPRVALEADVRQGERALLGSCVSSPRRIASVRLRAYAGDRVDRPGVFLPPFLFIEEPTIETWMEAEGTSCGPGSRL
jgi:hypothetical protein